MKDFKVVIIKYLESLVNTQQQVHVKLSSDGSVFYKSAVVKSLFHVCFVCFSANKILGGVLTRSQSDCIIHHTTSFFIPQYDHARKSCTDLMKPNDSTTVIKPESESLHTCLVSEDQRCGFFTPLKIQRSALCNSYLVSLRLTALGNDPAGEGLLTRFLFFFVSYVQNEALFSHNQYLRASIIDEASGSSCTTDGYTYVYFFILLCSWKFWNVSVDSLF